MSIAAVMVEILVVGIQAWLAVMLWALGYLGHGVVLKPLSLLAAHGGAWKWMPLLFLIVLSASYTLGIVVDRIARVLFDRVIRPVVRMVFPLPLRQFFRNRTRPIIEQEEVFVRVLHAEKGLSPFLQDYRSRLRIARASFLNCLLIWMAFWVTPQLRLLLPISPPTAGFVTILGGVIIAAWLVFWALHLITYEERLEQARRVMDGKGR